MHPEGECREHNQADGEKYDVLGHTYGTCGPRQFAQNVCEQSESGRNNDNSHLVNLSA